MSEILISKHQEFKAFIIFGKVCYNENMYIKEALSNTIIIEKSRFITYLKPMEKLEDFKTELKEIRKKHYDATHVCYAYIIEGTKKANDDGEPGGTAGMPILNVLEKRGVENIAAFVVRYFGGIKLGAGGLVRAYGNSVKEALTRAAFYDIYYVPGHRVICDYETANRLNHKLRNITVYLNLEYKEEVTISFALKNEDDLMMIKDLGGLKIEDTDPIKMAKVVE